MKVLVIPDVHLKPWMFDRAAELLKDGAADRAVCLMDIPDDWRQEFNLDLYVQTFDAAIQFAKDFPETLWCYGNHDRKKDYKDIFDEIYDGPLFIAEKILLSHEPVSGLPWCLNIHGHDHSGIEDYAEGCEHLNLAANVCGYTPVSLGKLIKDGILADIDSIHRITIDRAVERKQQKELSQRHFNY